MQRDEPSSPSERYSSRAAGSTFGSGGGFTSTGYDLGSLPNRAKRSPGQAYQGQGGLHQHGLSISGAAHHIPQSTRDKKGRFVSDGNIPSALGMGFGAGPSTQQTTLKAPQQPQAQQSSITSLSPVGLPTIPAGVPYSDRGFSPVGLQPSSLYTTAGVNALAPAGSIGGVGSSATFGGIPNGSPAAFAGSPMYPGFPPTSFGPSGSFVPTMMPPPPTQANTTGRTVYVGSLPADASVDELLNAVKFGPIENVRVLPEKSCAFISFLDGNTAASFHADASVKKLSLHGQELKIGWGKASSCPPSIMMAVQQNAATRNVYVQLGEDESITEESLRDDLSRFGPIDQVKIVRDKNIGFIHFLSIATAMKVVAQLPHEPEWAGKRVSYGKDRCAYVPKSQQQNQAHNTQAAAMGMAAAVSLGYPAAFSYGGMPASAPAGQSGFGPSSDRTSPGGLAGTSQQNDSLNQFGNRTIYLGNIHPETSIEEICNHIRGGILQTIRYLPEKHIAFVTFVDANSALAFHHLASYSGVMIHNRRLKIGWGKHSGPLSPAIAMAVQAGASRNVYVGNIEDSTSLSEEKLRKDFSQHGDVELVNSLPEKNCAFVNFCNIQNAIKAIEAMKNHEEYRSVKISHGKDRCGRTMPMTTGANGNLPLNGNHADQANGRRRASKTAESTPPGVSRSTSHNKTKNGNGNSTNGNLHSSSSGDLPSDSSNLPSSATQNGDNSSSTDATAVSLPGRKDDTSAKATSTEGGPHDMPPIDSLTLNSSSTPSAATVSKNEHKAEQTGA